MLNKQNVQLLNLQQQVEKNKEDIANHYNIDRVLADFGIKILGRVDTYEDLLALTPPTAGWEYGDAFAVGAVNTNYDYYIWTRPFDTAEEAYWFNVGGLSIVGPQGPQGEQGPAGKTGENARWFAYDRVSDGAYKDGDMLLTFGEGIKGNVYRYKESTHTWEYKMNIMGPQGPQGATGPAGAKGDRGPQGIQGPKGNPGKGPRLIATLTSIDDLPTPTEAIRDSAYVINGNLYMIEGDTSLVWKNFGPFPAVTAEGTTITINGVAQSNYDATKVVQFDSSGLPTGKFYGPVYIKNATGVADKMGFFSEPTPYTAMYRNSRGEAEVLCPEHPSTGYEIPNMGWVLSQDFVKYNYQSSFTGELYGATSDSSQPDVLVNKNYFETKLAPIQEVVNNIQGGISLDTFVNIAYTYTFANNEGSYSKQGYPNGINLVVYTDNDTSVGYIEGIFAFDSFNWPAKDCVLIGPHVTVSFDQSTQLITYSRNDTAHSCSITFYKII